MKSLRLHNASLTGKKGSGSEQIGFTDFAKIKFYKNVCAFKEATGDRKTPFTFSNLWVILKGGISYERKELLKQNHIELLKN